MKKGIAINEHSIGEVNPVFIIAEAGVNHNGGLKLAKKLIDAAKAAGADAIKFQTFKAEELATQYAPKAEYQKKTAPGKSQYEMLKKLELSEMEFKELFGYCRKKKIVFLSTPFDSQSAEFLYELGVPAFKVGSGDLTNIPLLLQLAKYGKPVILSTGMSTLAEVNETVKAIREAGNGKIILLHCTSNYPAKYEDANLRAMGTLRKKFDLPVGYSDHTPGIETAAAAVALGACIIEKHFTLSKNLPGPDHMASLEPKEFGAMVASIRKVEAALGNGLKEPRKSEMAMRKVARKSIVAIVDIQKGIKISRRMLGIKRPGTGIAPKYLTELIGRRLKRSVGKDRVLNWGLIA